MLADLASWTERFRSAARGCVSIVGSGKNSGKTTVLNYLLSTLPAGLGVTSIGYDGERHDLVSRQPKPDVIAPPGTLFATADRLLEGMESLCQELEATQLVTPLGRIVLARLTAGARIALAGPTTLSQMIDVKERLLALGARCVVVDGALDRVVSCSARLSNSVILVVGSADCGSEEDVQRDAAGLIRRFQIPQVLDRELAESVEVKSVHPENINTLSERTVLIPDPSCCLLGSVHWAKIDALKIRLLVERQVPVEAVFVNSFRPHRPSLSARAVAVRVLFIARSVPVFDLKVQSDLESLR